MTMQVLQSYSACEQMQIRSYHKNKYQYVVEQQQNEGIDDMDMYTRVKRVRRNVKKDMYGFPIAEEENQTEEDATTENEEDEEEEEEAGREMVSYAVTMATLQWKSGQKSKT